MRLSQTELKILEQIAKGNKDIINISEVINKSSKQIYKASQSLKDNEFLYLSKGRLEPRIATHVTLLLQLLAKHPNIIQILSGSGIQILASLLQQKTVKEIVTETGLKKSIIYEKINQAYNISVVVRKKKQKYVINKALWDNLRGCLEELKKLDDITDIRVPANSIIYYKTKGEIIFSNESELDATLTAFSAYENYGIKLLLTTKYYYLPNKTLSRKEIFVHSIYITEKEGDIRLLTYVALFYVKFKKEFNSIKHPLLEKIKKVLKGKNIRGCPSFEEIRDRAEIYDIRL